VFWFAFYGSCTCSAVVLYVVLSPLANKDIHTQLMQACGPHVLRGRTAGVSVSRDARSGWDFRTISRGRRGGGVGARLALQLIAARSPRSVRVTRKKCCDKKVSPRGRRDDMCPPPRRRQFDGGISFRRQSGRLLQSMVAADLRPSLVASGG